MERCDFLPVSAEEMHERGWWWYDALVVGGDAYVDHPSFGTAVISRVLEAEACAWPCSHSRTGTTRRPSAPWVGRGWACSSARAISTPWSRTTRRPSAAAARIFTPRQAHRLPARPRGHRLLQPRTRGLRPDMPIILGSLEASLRRFAHYDYWDDSVRRAILFDAPADLLVYGMGEAATIEIAHRLKKKAVRAHDDGHPRHGLHHARAGNVRV